MHISQSVLYPVGFSFEGFKNFVTLHHNTKMTSNSLMNAYIETLVPHSSNELLQEAYTLAYTMFPFEVNHLLKCNVKTVDEFKTILLQMSE
jgi:hypothetical protein